MCTVNGIYTLENSAVFDTTVPIQNNSLPTRRHRLRNGQLSASADSIDGTVMTKLRCRYDHDLVYTDNLPLILVKYRLKELLLCRAHCATCADHIDCVGYLIQFIFLVKIKHMKA